MLAQPPHPVLVVRLSNWIGDVVLTLPSLVRLSDAYALRLVGKGWMPGLLAAYGWPCHVYPRKLGERVALLRRLAAEGPIGTRAEALCFPTSLSSALEFRLAGLPAVGYAKEGRSLLLRRALPVPHAGVHMAEHFAQLASALLPAGATEATAELRLSADATARAKAALVQAGASPFFVAVCPFSSGTIGGESKDWPGFGELVTRLKAEGHCLVACPGPGEEQQLAERWPEVLSLPGLGVDAYAAVLSLATAVVANDTGPGHLAAAVGTPLVSVLGPTDPARWGPRGTNVHVLRDWPQWPTVAAVHRQLGELLSRGPHRARGVR
jgi:heptosyltransferase-2